MAELQPDHSLKLQIPCSTTTLYCEQKLKASILFNIEKGKI